jgi:hypothetical protein
MSKLSHKNLVKLYEQMGYEFCEIYPDLQTTTMYNSKTKELVTLTAGYRSKTIKNNQ